MERCDQHARPESGSIFSYSPSLFRKPTLGDGCAELVFRPSLLDGIRGVEGRKMSTDNLVRLVTVVALGSGVPTREVPPSIEKENGIVHYTGDQITERLLAQSISDLFEL